MTFAEITRTMLSSMDFFELRRTAARYSVPFQGVRRQKLMKDVERKILEKGVKATPMIFAKSESKSTVATQSPEGAVSAKPALKIQRGVNQKPVTPRINTFSARNNPFSRV